MDQTVTLQIILLKPTPGVVYGVQKGSGSNYETVQKQHSISGDLIFRLLIKIKGDRKKDELPKFSGEFVQGPAGGKFIYIDIGTYAGQQDSAWSRRLKIPLTGIKWENIDELTAHGHSCMETHVPGTGRDGGPNCATVKPFGGWQLVKM